MRNGKDMITKLLAGCACVALVAGATLGIEKLINDNKTEENTDTNVEQTSNVRIAEISEIVEI